MERTLIATLTDKVEETVHIAGVVAVRRDQGKMVFFDFRDRSGIVQGVVLPQSPALETAKDVRTQYVVEAAGVVHARPPKNVLQGVQNGSIELEVTSLVILSSAEVPFELESEVNLDTYLDHLPYTLRSGRSRDIFIVQATILETFRKAQREQDFVEFTAPALVGGDAEGGAAAFSVDYYYDQKAYLATSPQFYKQIMAGVFERAFTTAKVFRGEKSATTRHLSEFTGLDFEMAFIRDHRDIMAVLEKTMRAVASTVAEKHTDVLARIGTAPARLPDKPFPVLKLKEAQEILTNQFNMPCVDEPDLEPEHERTIAEWAEREHGSDFVFITHYPISKRPFYTYEDEADSGFTKSFDLLFRGLEIATGGQRVHDYQTLITRLQSRGLDPAKFAYYLETFKVGMPPHGGVGMGLERITARMLGLPNVKEATLFPRDMNRIDTLLSRPDDASL